MIEQYHVSSYLPEDRATSFKAINKLSPSTYANERFTHPTYVHKEKDHTCPSQLMETISLLVVELFDGRDQLKGYY